MITRFIASIKKMIARWERRTWLTKRQQFVIVTAILTGLLLLTQIVSPDLRYLFVILLSFAAYWLSAFALREDLKGVEWLTLLSLPTMFTAAVSLFYFLLPVRWLTRLPVALLYGVGQYALLLTENIYNVAADRTIALLRAAHSVGFLLMILTFFLLIQTILAFRFFPLVNTILVGIVSYLLIMPALWSMDLSGEVPKRIWHISLAVTVLLTETVWIFSYLPTKATIVALMLTTVLYSSVGMAQQYLVEKLYKKTAIEFIAVAAIVFVITLVATSWHGA